MGDNILNSRILHDINTSNHYISGSVVQFVSNITIGLVEKLVVSKCMPCPTTSEINTACGCEFKKINLMGLAPLWKFCVSVPSVL